MQKPMPSNANGFSLVEVIIAMLVLTVGMFALGASTGYVSAEIRNATWTTQRAFGRAEIIEQLRATPFDNVVTNATPQAVGRYNLTWTVNSVNPNLKTVMVIASGPAYRMRRGAMTTVVDTALVNIMRP